MEIMGEGMFTLVGDAALATFWTVTKGTSCLLIAPACIWLLTAMKPDLRVCNCNVAMPCGVRHTHGNGQA